MEGHGPHRVRRDHRAREHGHRGPNASRAGPAPHGLGGTPGRQAHRRGHDRGDAGRLLLLDRRRGQRPVRQPRRDSGALRAHGQRHPHRRAPHAPAGTRRGRARRLGGGAYPRDRRNLLRGLAAHGEARVLRGPRGLPCRGHRLARRTAPQGLHETVEPFKDLFGGVFFVSVGMLIDPAWLLGHWQLALGLAVFTIAARILANFAALTAVGEAPTAAADASFASLPIGEFSFILAQVALSQGLASPAIYPLAVTLCLTTTLASSVLLPRTHGAAGWAGTLIPGPVDRSLRRYRRFILRLEAAGRSSRPWMLIRPSATQIGLNFLGISALLLAARTFEERVSWGPAYPGLVWTLAAFVSLPFLNAMLRKTQAVTMILIEALSTRDEAGTSPHEAKPMRTKVFLNLASAAIAAWYLALSWRLLSPWPYTILPLAFMLVVGVLFWQRMNQFYSRLQLLLRDSLAKADAEPEAAAQALAHFAAALTPEKVHLRAFPLASGSWAVGKTIGGIDLRARTGSSVLQINRSGLPVPSPGPETELRAGDELILIGEAPQIERARAVLATGEDPSGETGTQSPDWAVSP
ncbi:MAG: cation:proton antiporter [Elusimicrobia bacterium]|nr:cation:proton antiporter [Elusimicrobiota bacterium]